MGHLALNDSLANVDRRFFHFTNLDAPSNYRAVQVIFEVGSGTCPVMVCDAYRNSFIVADVAWLDLSVAPTTINPIYINNANTINRIQVAKVSATEARLKISYNTYISIGSVISLDGKAQFKYQQYAQE